MNKVIAVIRSLELEGNTEKMGSYLIDLAKNGENPFIYESEFSKHFSSSHWYLKKAAVFCLLFALQIDKPEYRKKAIEFLKDKNEDEEVRRWSGAGLSSTYKNTQDPELMKIMMKIIQDPNDDSSIKESLLRAVLEIYGLSSRDQLFRNRQVLPSLRSMMATFNKELVEIEEMIK